MAKKLSHEYKLFLESAPVATVALKMLSADALVEFVIQVMRPLKQTDHGLEETLAWYLFEEIGWPEGRGYVQDAVLAGRYQYLTDTLSRTPCKKIHPRLELRRAHWKRPSQASFVVAHAMLQRLLCDMCSPSTLEDTRLTPPPTPDHAS